MDGGSELAARLRKRRITRRAAIGAVALVAVAAIAVKFVRDGGDDGKRARPAIVKVERGKVRTTITGVGSLSSETTASLGFSSGGRVTAIEVREGQSVQRGQVLARLDQTLPQGNLTAARAQLVASRALLQQQRVGHTFAESRQARAERRQGRAAAGAAKRTAKQTRRIEQTKLAGLRLRLRQAEADLARARAQRQLDAAEAAAAVGAPTTDARPEDDPPAAAPQVRDGVPEATAAVESARQDLIEARASADRSITDATDAVRSAMATFRVTAATGDVTIEPIPSEVAAAQVSVAEAQNAVAQAEDEVEGTVLRAPADGVVADIGVSVGEQISGGAGVQGSGTSGASSGTGAAAEAGTGDPTSGAGAAGGFGTAGTGSATGGDASSTSGEGASTEQAITLTGPRVSILEVPLTQADAVEVDPGDEVKLLLHSIRRTVRGQVVGISAVGQAADGVVKFNAKVLAPRIPTEVRAGMTADATVITEERANVPTIPLKAIPPGRGDLARVKVLSDGVSKPREVRLGLVGDTSAEIVAGLEPGEKILVPRSAGSGYPGFN